LTKFEKLHKYFCVILYISTYFQILYFTIIYYILFILINHHHNTIEELLYNNIYLNHKIGNIIYVLI